MGRNNKIISNINAVLAALQVSKVGPGPSIDYIMFEHQYLKEHPNEERKPFTEIKIRHLYNKQKHNKK